MFVRNGYGIVVPIIFLFSIILSDRVGGNLDEGIIISLTFMFTRILSTIFGFIVNNKRNDKVLYDRETEEEYTLKKRHILFYIQIQYFGIILILFSILLFYDALNLHELLF